MIIALREKGVHVVGTTEEFGIGGEGIWISGESHPGLFDYSSTTGRVSASGSFSGSFNGSLTGTATSASYAVSASHVIGGVDPFPYTGSAVVTGSLAVTGSVGFSTFLLLPDAWSAGGTLIIARTALAGAGEQNSALAFGGLPALSCTQEYNGSSWSAGGALSTGRYTLAGAGTQNAGLAFGGSTPSIVSCTEEYNGSSWSAGGALINARFSLAGAGEQNAALAFGGSTPSALSCTEEYNGTTLPCMSASGYLISKIIGSIDGYITLFCVAPEIS